MQQAQEQAVAYPNTLPIKKIVMGKNPRTHYDPAEMAELRASIAQNGVVQSVLVRPLEYGMYELVAGYRRYLNAKDALGEDYEIPVLVRELTDEEALELALIENIQRADMAPTEEAEAAARILGSRNGDHEETARVLGWNMQKLERRLALMNCSDKVREALNTRKILLGHAELLAAITKTKQDGVLEKLLTKEELVPVAAMKSMLAQMARVLADAPFDKTNCANCQHNSAIQGALFGEAIADGHCTNAECFNQKNEAYLEGVAESLKDEYPVTRIVRPGENFTVLKLVPNGEAGVGEEQAKACRGCEKFGAAISAIPGSIGTVYKAQCFDASCNRQKVAEHRKAEQEIRKAEAKASVTAATEKAALSMKAVDPSKPAVAKSVPSVQDSNRVKEYRVKIWRKAMKKDLMADPVKNQFALLTLGTQGMLRHVSAQDMGAAYEKLTGDHLPIATDLEKTIKSVANLSAEHLQTMNLALVATCMSGIEEHSLVQLLKTFKVDLANHWKVCSEFLDLLTKSEIAAVAEEIGLKAKLGDKWTKLMAGKKEEIIKSLLAVEDFDFAGKLPKAMLYSR